MNNVNNPKVTVFMPVYNTEKYLRDAIDSILSQTFENFELLIVDDGSTDSSVNIIKSYNDKRIKLYHNDGNKGLPYTRNRGLELAKGEYIAVFDSDDIAFKDRLKLQVDFLDKNKDIVAVFSQFVRLYDYPNVNKVKKKLKNLIMYFITKINSMFPTITSDEKYIRTFMLFSDCICNSSSMIRKSTIRENNISYRDEYFVCQDYAMWVDLYGHGYIGKINKPLLYFRCGHLNTTKKSFQHKLVARKKIVKEIQKRFFKMENIIIDQEEIELISDIYDGHYNEISEEQLTRLYHIFKSLSINNSHIPYLNIVIYRLWCNKINNFKGIIKRLKYLLNPPVEVMLITKMRFSIKVLIRALVKI